MRLRRIWENLRKGSTPDMVAKELDELVAGLEVAFTALDRIQKAAESFEVRAYAQRSLIAGLQTSVRLSASVSSTC